MDRPVSVIYFHGAADPLRYFNGGGQPRGDTLRAEVKLINKRLTSDGKRSVVTSEITGIN